MMQTKATARITLLLALLTFAPQAHPQGCTQCRESVGQTSPATQQAYRRGIFVLIAATGTVFLAMGLVMRHFR